MLRLSLRATLHGSERDAQALVDADNEVDSLYREVIRYLGKLSQNDLVGRQPTLLNDFVGIANYLENIGDVKAARPNSSTSESGSARKPKPSSMSLRGSWKRTSTRPRRRS